MSEEKYAKCSYYREAANRIWELAEEYNSKGLYELAGALKDLASKMHEIAHKKEISSINVEK